MYWEDFVPRRFSAGKILSVYLLGKIFCQENFGCFFTREDFVPGRFCPGKILCREDFRCLFTWEYFLLGIFFVGNILGVYLLGNIFGVYLFGKILYWGDFVREDYGR